MEDNQQDTWDIVRILIVILLATITSTILLVSFTDADTPYDNITFEINTDITGDCPHAMLIFPINNSVVNTRNPTLILYVYDNDPGVWFLNVTFKDYSDNSTIATLTGKSDFNSSTVWRDLTPGENYKWYAFLENTTGGNYTTGTYFFTVGQDIIGTSNDFYGTWILFGVILLLFTLSIVFKSIILGVASMITSLIVTITYANDIMATGSVFDDTMLYIFIFITMAAFLDVVYIIFHRDGR